MKNTIKFDKPLTFGDKDQIDAIRHADRQAEWDELEVCDECDGEGCCSKCDQDCQICDGLGRSPLAVEEFKKRHPGMTGFQICELSLK